MAAEPMVAPSEFQAELCVPCGNRLGECPLWDDLCAREKEAELVCVFLLASCIGIISSTDLP